MPRLLLVSNSRTSGGNLFDHCANEVRALLPGKEGSVVFIPYALGDLDSYAALIARRLGEMADCTVTSIHRHPHPTRALADAACIFVGGGNTFRLLRALQDLELLDLLRLRVLGGTPYIGSSAGANLACPDIGTTNDMPIVWPRSLDALGLLPFNINPHYFDPPDGWVHMGETREERILEFLEVNARPVVGLREGAFLVVDGGSITVGGANGARVFRRGRPPADYPPGSSLAFLQPQERAIT